MMRRRNSPPPRGQTAPRRAQDKEREIDSELRAARATRRASSAQKQQLRRLDWDDEEVVEETGEDTMVFDVETDDEKGDGPDDEEPAAR